MDERPLSLNPLIDTSDPAVVDVGHLLYRSLLSLDATGYPTTDLASSYTVTPDGLTYTVTLASGPEWSNGAPITAQDVLATVQFALSPQAGDATLAAALKGAKVTVSGTVITFKLATPRASFAATLTELPILPLGAMSPSDLRAVAKNPTVPLPTSGPYEVGSTALLSVVLQPNPHAPNRPNIKSYELRLFLTFKDATAAFAQGNVQAVLATTPQELAALLAVKGAQAESITTPDFVDMLFNEHVPGLTDSVVRHAIGVAVNRAAVVAGALDGRSGVVQTGPFSEGLPWVEARSIAAISPTVAETVLQGDGWAMGSDGVRHRGSTQLAFTLAVPSLNPLPVVATEVANQLDAIGVQVTIKTVAPESFLIGTLETGAFQLAIDAWSPAPDPDVRAFWRSTATPPHGYNVSEAAADPFLDAALDMLARSPGRSVRSAAAAQVTALLADDAPAVFLYTPRVSFVFRSPMPTAPMPAIGDESARYNHISSWVLH